MNEYETHLSSYDHSHKQRLKEMRQLTRDPMAADKARKAEAKANAGSGLISIKIGGDNGAGGGASGAGGGAKKGGFKKSGFKSAFVEVGSVGEGQEDVEMKEATRGDEREFGKSITVADAGGMMERDANAESDTDDEGYEMYDPRFPTD